MLTKRRCHGPWTVYESRRFRSISFSSPNQTWPLADRSIGEKIQVSILQMYLFMVNTTINRLFFAFDMRCNFYLLSVLFTVTCKPYGNKAVSCSGSEVRSLSMPFNQHSSAVYLWLKSYLVVKISSDIVTKHWYQICVLWLSMMSLPPRLPDLVSDCTIRKHEYHVVRLHSDRPDGHWYEKIFFTFDFHILPQQRHTSARIILYRCI